jgi:hypothetical protein
LENPVAKKRKKQTARKQRKQNLAGMDFQALMDLREEVESALSGYRATLEKQLSSIGGSIASVGRKNGGRRARITKGNESRAKVSESRW